MINEGRETLTWIKKEKGHSSGKDPLLTENYDKLMKIRES